jgi:hypothetical protein
VFYLPGHLFTAFLAGAALAPFGGPKKVRPATNEYRARAARTFLGPRTTATASLIVIAYAGWRAWDTWPAIDRHNDRRAEALVTRLTLGVNPQTAVLVTDLNWQLENALLYYSRWQRRDIPWVRLSDVEPHFPFLVRDNEAISRDIVMDSYSARDVVAAFGPLFQVQPDPIRTSPDLLDEISRLARGTPYVLCVLTPPREEHLDPAVLQAALDMLTHGHVPPASRRAGAAEGGPAAAYQLIAGLAGEAPLITRSADYPFRQEFRLLDDPFTVRMESWLPSDTFRRAGFGHVIRGHEHVLILERGVNFVSFDRNARPSAPLYAASLYAPGERYRISSISPSLARRSPDAGLQSPVLSGPRTADRRP